MAKQRKRRDPSDTAALFVRLPAAEAEKLDRIAFEQKIPKRELIRTLIAEELDPSKMDVIWQRPVPEPVRVPFSGPGLVVGHAASRVSADEVLTVSDAAELLQCSEEAIRELAQAGDLPGRKVGGEWRFLRRAVLEWLGAGAGGDRTQSTDS